MFIDDPRRLADAGIVVVATLILAVSRRMCGSHRRGRLAAVAPHASFGTLLAVPAAVVGTFYVRKSGWTAVVVVVVVRNLGRHCGFKIRWVVNGNGCEDDAKGGGRTTVVVVCDTVYGRYLISS